MYPSTNIWSGYSENITPSTETTTIYTSPQPFVSKYFFENIIQAMFAKYFIRFTRYDEIFPQSDEIFDKQQE